ncbi:MAG TPA: BMP family ABC transporter substrate-binding protein, partial [Albitalea sp.]|nr:BMP family ABC transporter substrate-binding protein [Albitalea sp.]
MIDRRAFGIVIGVASVFAFAGTAVAQETYIPLVSKGFQHQFWQAVKSGAEQAAKDYKVRVTFEGPETEAM